jgi:surfactin synthase thioesterase subunit
VFQEDELAVLSGVFAFIRHIDRNAATVCGRKPMSTSKETVKTSHRENIWIRRFHFSAPTAAHLVCFPYAGGSASSFFQMSKELSPEIEVSAVQYPGRHDRIDEECVESIPELAGHIAAELASFTDRPLVLFGHSMGAAVAFEAALRLAERDVVPLGLFVSGSRAPSLRPDHPLPADDDELIAELRRLGGTSTQLLAHEALMELMLPTIRSDYRAVHTYRHTADAQLDCPLVALTGDRDPVVDLDGVKQWQRHTSSTFRMRVFDGGHFFLEDHADAVRQELREYVRALTAP